MINKFNKIVFIASPPRSGSSILTKIFHENGFWIGDTKVSDRWNVNGYFENLKLRQLLINYLYKNDTENLIKKYQPINLSEPYYNFKTDFIEAILSDGYNNGWIVFKDPKICLTWKMINDNFPDATWIFLFRNLAKTSKSYQKTEFMLSLIHI